MSEKIDFKIMPLMSNGKVMYNGTFEGKKLPLSYTLSDLVEPVYYWIKALYSSRVDAKGTINIGNKSFTYKFEHFTHHFYDGDEQVYKHCSFEKGLGLCQARCNEGDPIVFVDWIGEIINPKYGVMPVVTASAPITSSTANVIEEVIEEEPEEVMDAGDLFKTQVDGDPAW